MLADRRRQARAVLQQQIEAGHFNQSITFNLATVYELSSEHARDLKLGLVERAAGRSTSSLGWEKPLEDFKL